jgi:hypothetical protein
MTRCGRCQIDRNYDSTSSIGAPVAARSTELAGTRQAAAHHHQTAALRQAEATAATDPAQRARLAEEARGAVALAETLDRRAEELQELDDARALWLAHTAGTRAPQPSPRRCSPNATPMTPNPSSA